MLFQSSDAEIRASGISNNYRNYNKWLEDAAEKLKPVHANLSNNIGNLANFEGYRRPREHYLRPAIALRHLPEAALAVALPSLLAVSLGLRRPREQGADAEGSKPGLNE